MSARAIVWIAAITLAVGSAGCGGGVVRMTSAGTVTTPRSGTAPPIARRPRATSTEDAGPTRVTMTAEGDAQGSDLEVGGATTVVPQPTATSAELGVAPQDGAAEDGAAAGASDDETIGELESPPEAREATRDRSRSRRHRRRRRGR